MDGWMEGAEAASPGEEAEEGGAGLSTAEAA